MINFDMRDIERVVGNIQRVSRQLDFVNSYALNSAAKDVRDAEVNAMRSVFDNPTSYTLNALQIRPSTKNNLRVEVGFKEFGGTPAWKYLGPQVQGGPRKHKGFERALIRAGIMKADEFAMPGGAVRRTKGGNVSGGLVTQILSALGASPDAHQNRKRQPRRNSRKSRVVYFVLRGRKAPDGIYQRIDQKTAVPIFVFTKAPNYRARLPYYETARRVFTPAFRKHFRVGYQRFVVNDSGRKRAA